MTELLTVEESCELLARGTPVLFAGAEPLLRRLPRGNWIGGTIPYFMTNKGGVKTSTRLFATALPNVVQHCSVKYYPTERLRELPTDYPSDGASFIILPASSSAHVAFAKDVSTWPGIFERPLVGWVAGVDLDELGKAHPRVFDGASGESFDDGAVVLHATLPPGHHARVDIVNLFSQGTGSELVFPVTGFEVETVLVDGRPTNFADYVLSSALDTRLPLVADYNGAMVNVSLQSVDAKTRKVALYAPVFEGIRYRFAKPLDLDYADAFQREFAARGTSPIFACNCILNFLYGHLEGRQTGTMTGPVTFGEIAYMLLNQTMVYIEFEKAT